MDMDDRKIKILQAIIDDYINTGEPIGSRTIAKKYDLGISSATIRNEMADLEDMGYLVQLHTSSGRKPSDKGYRLYVDRLMHLEELSKEEELIIKGNLLNCALYEVDKIIKQASILLSELTNLTCIVTPPSVKKSYIKTVQLVNIDMNSVLSVILTDNGLIKNNIIRINKPISSEGLMKLNYMLDARLRNLTIEQINLEVINHLKQDLMGHDDIFNAIIPALYETLNLVEPGDVLMEGETNILNYPEYNDIERAKEFIAFLNNKENVKGLLTSSDDITVSIGGENFMPGAKEYSVISKVYTIGEKPVGSIGLIGPTRMHYSKVISILTKVIKEVNDNLSQNYDEW
jgi:heat-inducible transcriptional repressor